MAALISVCTLSFNTFMFAAIAMPVVAFIVPLRSCIWALGEIGGTPARRALDRLLADADEDDVTEAIEDALACAALSDEEMPWGRL